ncbi:MAG: hypothetical protein CMJ34_10985 [Phycisphaerae bacterium]|nr:hypothetical protein [Phycisphaerae bacterium]
MSVLIPVLILSSICSIPETTSADDRWQLVFEDDFSARTDPTADWTRFGDTSPQTRGREGGGLLLTAPAGQEPPSYSGAVNRLGGSVATDQTVTASLAWRPIGGEPGDARLALKLEFKDREGGTIDVAENQVPLSDADSGDWGTIEVAGRVPAETDAVDVAVVIVAGGGEGVRQVMIDDLVAFTTPPAPDLLGKGGFESNDGGAPGWSAFNNAVAVDHPERGRVLKTWGPYNEPYGGSGLEQIVPLKDVRPGSRISAGVEAMTERRDSIADTDNFPVIRLECRAANGRPLAHAEGRPFDPNRGDIPEDEWVRSDVSLVVPDGTTNAKLILVFIQPTTAKGSVLWRNPAISMGGEMVDVANPEFTARDETLPGWLTTGDVTIATRDQRSGAGAARLVTRDGQAASIGRSVTGVGPGSTARIEAWFSAELGDGVVVDVEQTASDGTSLGVLSREVPLASGGGWTSLESAAGPFDVRISPDAAAMALRITLPEEGTILVDDVSIRDLATVDQASTSLPVRNPGFEGGRPDPTRWVVSDGAWSHNGELQYYSPDAVRIEDGRMLITADRRRIGDREYASAHLTTQGIQEQTYGRWEIRAKLPGSQGMWPAIWLLPEDGSWPPEIDIIELVGKEPNRVHHSFHWGPLRDGLLPWDLNQTSTDHHDAEDYASTWHDFAVEWTPERITWFVDGDETHRFGRVSKQREKIPDKPMYLILNLAIGGFWPGPPGDATRWPSTMEIDSVRIYRLVGDGG